MTTNPWTAPDKNERNPMVSRFVFWNGKPDRPETGDLCYVNRVCHLGVVQNLLSTIYGDTVLPNHAVAYGTLVIVLYAAKYDNKIWCMDVETGRYFFTPECLLTVEVKAHIEQEAGTSRSDTA